MEKGKADSKGAHHPNGKAVLVTGATSHLGIAIVKRLVERGYDVRVTIMDATSRANDWKMLPPGVKPYVIDLTLKTDEDKAALNEACRGVDILYHLAGATFNFNHSYERLINTNVIGTENLINTYITVNGGRRARKLRFVFTSSISVYGYNRRGETLNEDSVAKPVSNYSRSKLMAEQVIKAYADTDPNLSFTTLRLSTLYGDGYTESFFKVFRMVKEGKMRYLGDGRNHLTLLHIDDAAEAIIACGESPEAANKVYNLTDGNPYTLKFLIEKVAELLHVPPPSKNINKMVARIGRGIMGINYDEFEFLTSDRVVSIERLKEEVGFTPRIKIEEGSQEMISIFLSRNR